MGEAHDYAPDAMASEQPPSDPFRVRLNWPDEAKKPLEDDEGGDVPAEETPAAERPKATTPSKPRSADVASGPPADVAVVDEPNETERGSVIFTVASRLEGLRAALTTVSHRLDSMIQREEQFREFTTARLAEHAQQMALAAAAGSHDLAEGMRNQDRAMTEFRNAVENSVSDLRKVLVSDVADLREGLEASVRDLRSGLVPDLVELRGRFEEATEALSQSVDSKVGELQKSTRSEVAELRSGVEADMASLTSKLEASLTSLSSSVDAVTDRLDVMAKVVSAVGPTIEHAMEVTRQVGEDLSDLLQRQSVEIDVVRSAVVSSATHAEERDEELSAEVARLSEELKAIRRRMAVRARPAGGREAVAPLAAPVDQDAEDFEPPPPPRPRRAPRRAREE